MAGRVPTSQKNSILSIQDKCQLPSDQLPFIFRYMNRRIDVLSYFGQCTDNDVLIGCNIN